MAQDKRDVLEVLQFELSFLEQGGDGRSVRTPGNRLLFFKTRSPALTSMSRRGRIPATNACSTT
jgi:hypothetical protein